MSETGTDTKIDVTSFVITESSLKYVTVTKNLQLGIYQLIFTYSKV